TFIAVLLFGRYADGRAREALCAASLLSGFMFQTVLWGALRWAGAGYGAVVAAHCAASAVLGIMALRGAAGRAAFMGAMRSFFSAEAAAFLALAVLLAALFTYDSVPLYYGDELLRMSMAWSAGNGLPAQNILVWTGVLKYYYAAEFFAGSASAVTGAPLETVYFRFFLPLNWTLLFFGIRGVLAQYKPGFRRYVPHAAFLLFFVSHVNMLTHFTFRQNTLAVGLAALSVSAAWTCLSGGGGPLLLVCAASPALVTLVKAPCGALLLVFFCALVLLGAVRGHIGKTGAAAAAVSSMALWYLAYRSFCGGGFRDAGSLLGLGAVMGSMPEFLPEYIAPPALLSALPDMFGAAGGLMAGALVTAENLLSFLVIGAV
ncbi:MAG TPA: hypothetical protein PL037_09710, partial [Elusimicrobiales bacterium]|nr:hypothetical protein [Elusimicrobiales bacterium]